LQTAKAQLDRACAAARRQVDDTAAALQAEQRAAVDPGTLAHLKRFVETAAAERESLKRSLATAAKVRVLLELAVLFSILRSKRRSSCSVCCVP
jgi:hypothetical protein